MAAETPLAKRIRRHVIGRMREFFIAVAPGFEAVCLKELQAPPLSIEGGAAVPGGIVFQGRLEDCWRANLHLRTAGRILMRIETFTAVSFPQLQKKLSDIPWELYLQPDLLPVIHVTAAKSRLYHSDAIAARVSAGIVNRFAATTAPEAAPGTSAVRIQQPDHRSVHHHISPTMVQKIFVRAAADRFTISIDSSGALLYKRGVKTRGGKAPIRETIAAAALLLAGYTGKEPLVDPMCGSGTFSIEAAMTAGNVPAGAFRTFAFMEWPSFAARKWAYLKRVAASDQTFPGPARIFASDIDADAVISLLKSLEDQRLLSMVDARPRDFFALSPADASAEKGLIVLNPPYGRRLGSRRQSRDLFRSMCRRLQDVWSGWRIVLVAPEPAWIDVVSFPLSRHPFTHGGLRPTLLIGKIP